MSHLSEADTVLILFVESLFVLHNLSLRYKIPTSHIKLHTSDRRTLVLMISSGGDTAEDIVIEVRESNERKRLLEKLQKLISPPQRR